MVNEFCGFKHGVIGTDKIPADTTLNNMKKADLIKLLHTAQHNYETLMWFYNNAVKVNMSQLNNNGWIPCSERLPKCENGCETKALMFQMKETGSIKCGYYGEGGFYRDKYFRTYTNNTDGYDARDVVAWQPLPEPYQKGSDV